VVTGASADCGELDERVEWRRRVPVDLGAGVGTGVSDDVGVGEGEFVGVAGGVGVSAGAADAVAGMVTKCMGAL
jgi:hypothetical protein